MESDDEETQIQELQQLHAVLEAEGPTAFECSSRHSGTRDSVSSHPSISAKDVDEYSRIQKALALNKLTDEKMRRLERVLISRLHECRQKLTDIQIQQTPAAKSDKRNVFRYINCARPYFKDPDGFPPPANEDTITMRESGMLDFSIVMSVAGWTVKDKSVFLKQILKMTKEIRKREINSEISQLKRDMKVKDSKTIPKKLAALKKELDKVNSMVLNEKTVMPLDYEYDWDALASSLNRRHSPREYRALWKLFLHPSINKTKWNKAEHTKLQELTKKYSPQDWDSIASELGTNRTGYQCFVYYKTNMGNTFTGQKWTKEEEEYLRRLIDYYRDDNYIPWGRVATTMGNRTTIQIYNKYARLLELRKGRFLPEEDAVLLTCLETFGPDFRKILKYLPGRSIMQLRQRYHTLNNKSRTSMVWTVDEDRKLIQLMANQDCTVNFSAITKHFPHKNRVQLRARYVTLVKWIKKHPNKDIARAPRRGARRLGHGQCSGDLNKAVENLKKRMQSEVEIKKSKKITKNSTESAIDDAIVANLLTEHVREEEFRKLCENTEIAFDMTNVTGSETDIKKILLMLKARLNKAQFEQSTYAIKYPRLTQDALNFTVKLKSYSRKSKIKVIKKSDDRGPDIWGVQSKCLKDTEHVFPPHYATITGCKKLMAYTSRPTKEDGIAAMQHLIRRNVVLREQYEIFLDRFCTLFLWPMLLSNEEPRFRMITKPNITPEYERKMKQDREKMWGISATVPIPRVFVQEHPQSKELSIDLDTSKSSDIDLDYTVIAVNEDFGVLNL